ncbi:unnamed protein product [Bemisia tabaci]|uniref:Uncharacterized protein n=1 Tax=Bemisia tabaci TaxID=7038 RepID=A0A9P0A7E0_BEMTA|nr:unnamed protein product [Bemisia tabaci]
MPPNRSRSPNGVPNLSTRAGRTIVARLATNATINGSDRSLTSTISETRLLRSSTKNLAAMSVAPTGLHDLSTPQVRKIPSSSSRSKTTSSTSSKPSSSLLINGGKRNIKKKATVLFPPESPTTSSDKMLKKTQTNMTRSATATSNFSAPSRRTRKTALTSNDSDESSVLDSSSSDIYSTPTTSITQMKKKTAAPTVKLPERSRKKTLHKSTSTQCDQLQPDNTAFLTCACKPKLSQQTLHQDTLPVTHSHEDKCSQTEISFDLLIEGYNNKIVQPETLVQELRKEKSNNKSAKNTLLLENVLLQIKKLNEEIKKLSKTN